MAEQKQPQTIKTYMRAIRTLIEVVGDKYIEQVTKEDIREYLAVRTPLISTATLDIEYRALRVFFRWLVSEGDLEESPLSRIKHKRPVEAPPPLYTNDEISRLLEACRASRSKFAGIRDAAMILLLLDAGMRRTELASIELEDVDLDQQVIYLRVTKNGTPRIVPIGVKATAALDRYIRLRSKQPHAHLPQLFIGQAGAITGNGIYQALKERGLQAGVKNVRPHRFRHTFAHRATMAGMQTGELMAIAGWKSVQMVLRYGASAQTERAIAAHRKFSPVDNL